MSRCTMAQLHPTPTDAAAQRDALRWEHKREQSRARWERDKHTSVHTWPETLQLRWPKAAETPASRDTTRPDTRPTLPPRSDVTRP